MGRFLLGLFGIALAISAPLGSASARGVGAHNPQHDWCDPEIASNKGHEFDPVCLARNTPLPTAVVLSPQPIPGNENCREYSTSVVVNGQPEPAYGTVCRRPDGTWQFVR